MLVVVMVKTQSMEQNGVETVVTEDLEVVEVPEVALIVMELLMVVTVEMALLEVEVVVQMREEDKMEAQEVMELSV